MPATVTVEVGALSITASCDHGADHVASAAGALVKAIENLETALKAAPEDRSGGLPLGDLVILELGGSLMPAAKRRENTPVPTSGLPTERKSA